MSRTSKLGVPGVAKKGNQYYVTVVLNRTNGAVYRKKYFSTLDDAIEYKWNNREIIKL